MSNQIFNCENCKSTLSVDSHLFGNVGDLIIRKCSCGMFTVFQAKNENHFSSKPYIYQELLEGTDNWQSTTEQLRRLIYS